MCTRAPDITCIATQMFPLSLGPLLICILLMDLFTHSKKGHLKNDSKISFKWKFEKVLFGMGVDYL